MSELIFIVESDALPAGTRVAAFEGRERLSVAHELDVWLLVPGSAAPDLDPDAVILQPAALRVLRDDASTRWATAGLWTSFELAYEMPGGDSLYRASLAPTVWKLKLSRHSRVWVDKTVPFIVEDVLQKAGLSGKYSVRLSGRHVARDHVCQYRESDFDFIARLMEEEGIYWFFEASDAGDTLVLVDDKGRHESLGAERYVPELGAGDSGNEGFRSFTRREVYLQREVRVRDHDPLHTRTALSADAPVVPTHQGIEVRHGEDNVTRADIATHTAETRAGQELAGRAPYRGTGRVFHTRPGFKFTLEEHPRASFNQEYLCVEVRHRARLLTDLGEFEPYLPTPDLRVYYATVEAIAATAQFRAPRDTPKPLARSVELARVDGPAESEYAQIDAHGRYHVRMLFDENDTRAGESSTWVRMLQPHAGAPEGMHFPLRKGTEVTVIFLGGDPDRPMILGAVPNADTPSPVTESNHTQNVIHTGGDSRIEIEDTDGSQYIDISTPPEHTFIHLGAHHGSHGHNYISSTDGNGLIHTGGTLDVTVGGDKHEHVKGTVRETYKDTQTTEVKDTVTEEYQSNMTTTVTAHVQENYGTHTTRVADKTIETCASQRTAVSGHLEEHHGEQHTTIGGRLYVRSGDHTATTTGASTGDFGRLLITVQGTFTMTSAGPIRINALNWQDNAPITYTLVTNVRQIVTVNNKIVVKPFFGEIIGSKTNTGTFAMTVNRSKAEANGAVFTFNKFKLDVTVGKTERIGMKIKINGVLPKKFVLRGKKFAFTMLG